MTLKIYRGWINQPSRLQPDHALHGKVGIVVDDGQRLVVKMFFTEGPVHSLEVLRTSVAEKD